MLSVTTVLTLTVLSMHTGPSVINKWKWKQIQAQVPNTTRLHSLPSPANKAVCVWGAWCSVIGARVEIRVRANPSPYQFWSILNVNV